MALDAGLAEALAQMLAGADIPKPTSLNALKAEDAATRLTGTPYSVLTNLAHAVLWQDTWLARLAGKPVDTRQVWADDFRVPDASEYPALRKRFAEGLAEAHRFATGETPHQVMDDAKAVAYLARIVIHASYHLGQMSTLRRMSKAKGRQAPKA